VVKKQRDRRQGSIRKETLQKTLKRNGTLIKRILTQEKKSKGRKPTEKELREKKSAERKDLALVPSAEETTAAEREKLEKALTTPCASCKRRNPASNKKRKRFAPKGREKRR